MMLHQFCRICKRIMTIEEQNKHLEDFLGLCNKCREDKKHADSLIERITEAEKEE